VTLWPINAGASPPHPRGWAWRPLTSVAELVTGHTPDRKRPDYWNGGISWVNLNEIRKLDGRVCCETELQISPAGVANSSAVVHPAGTVCLSRTASVGFVTIMGAPMATSQDFVNWICGPELDPKYLMAALRASRPNILGMCSGSTHKTMYVRQAERLQVLLPPLEEQRRIVSILDKANDLIAKRRSALEQLDSLTQAIFLDMFGDPIRGKGDRSRTTLGEAAEIVGGGTPSRDRADFFEGTICWATSKDMKDSTLRDTQEHITRDAISASATKLVPPGAVLVVVKSKVLAKRLPVAVAAVQTCFGQDLKAILPNPRWQSSFLAESIRAAAPQLLRQARGVNTEGLTLEHLRSVPLWDATAEEQAEFDRRVEAVSRSSAAVRLGADKVNALFAAFQSRAFRGEL